MLFSMLKPFMHHKIAFIAYKEHARCWCISPVLTHHSNASNEEHGKKGHIIKATSIRVAGNERRKLPLRLGGSQLVVTQQGRGLLAAQGIPSCFRPTNALPGAPAHISNKPGVQHCRPCSSAATDMSLSLFLRLTLEVVYCSANALLQLRSLLVGFISPYLFNHSSVHHPSINSLHAHICWFVTAVISHQCT